MKDLIDTTEMYLRTIYDLEEEGVTPLRARISERLEHSGPTVSQTINRMERDGLVKVASDRHLELTEKGRNIAIKVMRKHRLAERLLIDIIGLDWEEVHSEACRWEHVMSEQVERRLLTVLKNPTTSPYGNPIPGLEELGAPIFNDAGEYYRLPQLPVGEEIPVVVRRLAEHVQNETELMVKFREAGIVPNARITAQVDNHGVIIHSAGHTQFELSEELANAVQVEKI